MNRVELRVDAKGDESMARKQQRMPSAPHGEIEGAEVRSSDVRSALRYLDAGDPRLDER